jgi:hypothetical protein
MAADKTVPIDRHAMSGLVQLFACAEVLFISSSLVFLPLELLLHLALVG